MVNVHFFEPPPPQRLGGLDAAIAGWRAALTRAGVCVDQALPGARTDRDLVHFHGLWQPGHSRLSRQCLARRIPLVVSPHGMLEPWAWRHKWWKKWPYFHLIEKRHLQRARCLLATAPTEAERLHRMFPTQRIESLPLGLTGDAPPDYENARRALGWSTDERVLLFLSRIHLKKGLDLLLRALTQTDAARIARLVIVGGGDERTVCELRAFAKTHAASLPSVEWMGEVWGEAKWKFFQGADLFCLPTRSENFGLAVLEALQVGTPVLTTQATPWVGLIEGIRGWIAEPRVEDLRKALVEFFATPRLTTSQRAEIARSTIAKFNWDALIPRYLELYRSLLEGL